MPPIRLRLLLLGAALAFALAEIGIRLYDLAQGNGSNARSFWYALYEQDPFLGFRGRPDVSWRGSWRGQKEHIRHNDRGFRDDRAFGATAAAPEERLIVCLGESSTYGLGAGRNDLTYPAALERALKELAPETSWRVMNGGMPGYTSYESVALLRLHFSKYRPAAVVMMNLRNDYHFVGRFVDKDFDQNQLPIRQAQISRTFVNDLLMKSALFAFVRGRLRAHLPDDLSEGVPRPVKSAPTRRAVSSYLENLAIAKLMSSRHGFRLFLVDQPVVEAGYSEEHRRGLKTMREALREFGEAEGVPVLAANDLRDWGVFSQNHEVHLGAPGYLELAEILAEQLVPHLPS